MKNELDKSYISEKQVLTPEIIENLLEEHYEKAKYFIHYHNLFLGGHSIIKRETGDNQPNNKLINDYFGELVEVVLGYFAGKDVNINFEDDDIQEVVDEILTMNNLDNLFLETVKEMVVKGRTAWLVYQNEYAETKLQRVKAEEVFFIFNATKTDEVEYGIRCYDLEVVGGKQETITKVEVYDKDNIYYYTQDEKGNFYLEDTESHIFDYIPLILIKNNEEEQSDFEKIESLVDDYNKVFSDSSNENEAYRNAYLMLKNMVATDDTLKRLKDEGIIEVDESGDAKFLTKQIQYQAIDSHLDRLENNIHKFSQVPNLNDKNFGNNLSGISIKFKLFGLEAKCIIKERKITKALRELLKVLDKVVFIKTGKHINISKTQFIFTRNVPVSFKDKAEVVNKLAGIVDEETLLSILPFIDNASQVIKKREEEQEEEGKKLGDKLRAKSDLESELDAVDEEVFKND